MMFYETVPRKSNQISKFLFFGILLAISICMTNSCTYNKFSPPASSGCTATDTTNVSYSKQVAPIIIDNCFTSQNCHNGPNSFSPYRYDSYASLQTFLNTSSFPEGSTTFVNCIKQTGGKYPNMPLTGNKLSNCDISILVNWINEGYPNN